MAFIHLFLLLNAVCMAINGHECAVLHVISNFDHQREMTACCISADDSVDMVSKLGPQLVGSASVVW